MNIARTFGLASICLCLAANSAAAQGDFFWSFNDLNSGATNSLAAGNFAVGDTGSLYLYHARAADDIDAVAGLDLSFTNNDVIHFTAAETFNFDIVITQAPDITIGGRWSNPDGNGGYSGGGVAGPAGSVSGNEVTALNAFTVDGYGMIDSNSGSSTFFDAGYDIDAEAFLFGRIDFVAVGTGSTSLETAVGSIGIVGGGQAINPVFGGANVTVGVPEPTSAGCLALGLLAFVARRQRS